MIGPAEVDSPPRNRRPTVGQRTRRQANAAVFTGSGIIRPGYRKPSECSHLRSIEGFYPYFASLLVGSYATYRKQRKHPTIAFVLANLLDRIAIGGWEVEADDDADPRAVEWTKAAVLPHVPAILDSAIEAVIMGNQPFEVVWTLRDGLYWFDRFIPLVQDVTQLLVDAKGRFAGLRNLNVDLPPEQCWFVTYQASPGEPYGVSILENIRETAWIPWLDTVSRLKLLEERVSDIIPIIMCPDGSFTNAEGQTISYADEAKKALQALPLGQGVVMVHVGLSADDIRLNPELAKTSLSSIQTLDFGNRAESQSAMIEELEYFDTQMSRGLLRSERTTMATMGGTKADSEQMTENSEPSTERIAFSIAKQFNEGPLAKALTINFGPDQAEKIRMVPLPLVDSSRAVAREAIRLGFNDDETRRRLCAIINWDELLDSMDIPAVAPFGNVEDRDPEGEGDA